MNPISYSAPWGEETHSIIIDPENLVVRYEVDNGDRTPQGWMLTTHTCSLLEFISGTFEGMGTSVFGADKWLEMKAACQRIVSGQA